MTSYYPGEHDIQDDSETVTFRSKAVGISHPLFYYRLSAGEIQYDIGLITMETSVDFSNKSYSHIRLQFCLAVLIQQEQS